MIGNEFFSRQFFLSLVAITLEFFSPVAFFDLPLLNLLTIPFISSLYFVGTSLSIGEGAWFGELLEVGRSLLRRSEMHPESNLFARKPMLELGYISFAIGSTCIYIRPTSIENFMSFQTFLPFFIFFSFIASSQLLLRHYANYSSTSTFIVVRKTNFHFYSMS